MKIEHLIIGLFAVFLFTLPFFIFDNSEFKTESARINVSCLDNYTLSETYEHRFYNSSGMTTTERNINTSCAYGCDSDFFRCRFSKGENYLFPIIIIILLIAAIKYRRKIL